jgi:hypothetical protein
MGENRYHPFSMRLDPPTREPRTLRPLITAAIASGALYTLDAWVIGQGGIVTFCGLIGIVIALFRSGAAGFGRRWPGVSVHVGVALIWASTIALTWVSIGYQARTARSRAETVVAACKAYRTANGAYPDDLQQLVPRFLPSVPRAKYTLGLGNFVYTKGVYEGTAHTSLMFVTIAPFMRTSYLFEDDRWVTID